MAALVIELAGLEKMFKTTWMRRDVRALTDVSLTVEEGEAFGFVGPNGAGKSTTIKILMGSIYQSSGIAKLNGIECRDSLARKSVGYVPESPYLYDYLTPIEILMAGCSLHGVNVQDRWRHCMGWLDRFGLSSAAKRTLRSFSKGMTQRVALAYALAIQPRLLVLDEPLSGLDPLGRKDVIDILLEYRKTGGTIFFSSHVLYDVERLADRFGLIHQGRLATVQSPRALAESAEKMMIRSVGELPIPGGTEESCGCWRIDTPPAQLWNTLENIRNAGHRVLEVKSGTTLESAFIKYVGAGELSAEQKGL